MVRNTIPAGGHRLTLADTFFPRRALRLRQRAFASARREVSQSDDDFLRGVCDGCLPWQRQFILELRTRLAGCCTCEPRSILAEDSTAELHPVMGETSFIGWFITLGDLGPEQTFFLGLERLHEEKSGKPAFLGSDAEHGLREMWVNGCPLADWIRAVLTGFERASLAGGMSNGRAR
jgi:hypothetical protein